MKPGKVYNDDNGEIDAQVTLGALILIFSGSNEATQNDCTFVQNEETVSKKGCTILNHENGLHNCKKISQSYGKCTGELLGPTHVPFV